MALLHNAPHRALRSTPCTAAILRNLSRRSIPSCLHSYCQLFESRPNKTAICYGYLGEYYLYTTLAQRPEMNLGLREAHPRHIL